MRDRLIELIRNSGCVETWNHYTDDYKEPNPIDELADYLLENGVIVPPCKVGDKVYQTIMLKDGTGFIVERNVVGFHLGDFPKIRGCCERPQYLIVYHETSHAISHIDIKQIGKTVFLTREEAEAKLKGGGE